MDRRQWHATACDASCGNSRGGGYCRDSPLSTWSFARAPTPTSQYLVNSPKISRRGDTLCSSAPYSTGNGGRRDPAIPARRVAGSLELPICTGLLHVCAGSRPTLWSLEGLLADAQTTQPLPSLGWQRV